jgi:hypothetical protein
VFLCSVVSFFFSFGSLWLCVWLVFGAACAAPAFTKYYAKARPEPALTIFPNARMSPPTTIPRWGNSRSMYGVAIYGFRIRKYVVSGNILFEAQRRRTIRMSVLGAERRDSSCPCTMLLHRFNNFPIQRSFAHLVPGASPNAIII